MLVHSFILHAPDGALFKCYGNPKKWFNVNEQHLIHLNFIAKINLKINRHKKISTNSLIYCNQTIDSFKIMFPLFC